MNKHIQRGLALVGALSSGAVMAQTAPGGPDMSGLTAAVDFGTVTVAILSVAGALAMYEVVRQRR